MGGKLRAFNFWPEWYFNFQSRALGSSDYTGSVATMEAVEAGWLMMWGTRTHDRWHPLVIGRDAGPWWQNITPHKTIHSLDFSSRTELYQVENLGYCCRRLILFLDQKMTLSLSGLLVRWHVMRHAATCPIIRDINRYPGTRDTRLVNYWTARIRTWLATFSALEIRKCRVWVPGR